MVFEGDALNCVKGVYIFFIMTNGWHKECGAMDSPGFAAAVGDPESIYRFGCGLLATCKRAWFGHIGYPDHLRFTVFRTKVATSSGIRTTKFRVFS